MEAREREALQTLRPSTKRPWEAVTSLQNGHWHGTRLPPIEPTPYNHSPASVPRFQDNPAEGRLHNYEDSEARGRSSKKAKLEGNIYNAPPSWGTLPLDTSAVPSHKNGLINPPFTSRERRISYDSPQGHRNLPPSVNPKDASYLCRRCKRAIREEGGEEEEEHGVSISCDSCSRNPELAYITQAAATRLLQLAETLRTGKPSEQRILNPSPGKRSSDYPPIEQNGLKSTLAWLLGKINEVNQLADRLVQQTPAGAFEDLQRRSPTRSSIIQDGLGEKVNRRFGDFQDLFTRPGDRDGADLGRRSSTAPMVNSDENLPLGTQSSYHLGQPSSMNRPPTSNQQLPSPPGRQVLSPASLNQPSPSVGPYISAQSVGQGHHLGTTQPAIATPTSDSAFQAHTAALQHEVSVQKIALSSLQGEHDKLLAAFSRSQTRATALEKKHAVSDGEIINLTEEKLRLQQQLTELEKDVEDMTKSRDEYRQSAVLESAQYIDIVKKASHLEALAGEEKKEWNRLKAEMEAKIESLNSRTEADDRILLADSDRPGSITTSLEDGKVDSKTTEDVEKGGLAEESVASLKKEIERLRSRCTKVEDTLRAVRTDTERIIGSVTTSGRTLAARVDNVLDGLERNDGDAS
ncbi:hypothetical protein BP6252_07676 [Coleophoma cylindrospora]|uniref:Uncharacterized protein n=1 Tax=Coleophoma cylindrospora TaxID=1849047 RepID=A0A3D8RAN8_9HELO|nr:hypothetical protein BP6252_07676 [Coleophoma cylindrospora]